MSRSFIFCFVLLFFCVSCFKTFSQTKKLDSLKLALTNSKHDTTKCGILESLTEIETSDSLRSTYCSQLRSLALSNIRKNSPYKTRFYRRLSDGLFYLARSYEAEGDLKTAFSIAQERMDLAKESKFPDRLADAANYLGHLYEIQGDYLLAKDQYELCLKANRESGDKQQSSIALNNIATICYRQGVIEKALEYFHGALKVQTELGDKKNSAYTLANMAVIYKNQGDMQKAIEFCQSSIKLRKETGDKYGTAISYNNLGSMYERMGDLDLALKNYMEAQKVNTEIDNQAGLATCLNNIGTIFRDKGDFLQAKDHYLKSLDIYEKINDGKGIASLLGNAGFNFLKLSRLSDAETYMLKGIKKSREIGSPELISFAAKNLSELYKLKGNYKLSLENCELHIKMRDSISNQNTRKASVKSQLKFEYEKKAAADSVAHAKENEIKSAELSRQSAEIKAKKNQQVALCGGLVLVLLFAGFMYNRFKVTQKQKLIIEHQKEEVEEQKKIVEEKQTEILDSIRYAKRIQLAQIPTEKRISAMLQKIKG
jgi:tetratricopeptide (TPR) repeat protein